MVSARERAGAKSTPRLVVFDLDGTLLRPYTACEVLAQRLGHAERMAEIERISGKDEIVAARVEMAG